MSQDDFSKAKTASDTPGNGLPEPSNSPKSWLGRVGSGLRNFAREHRRGVLIFAAGAVPVILLSRAGGGQFAQYGGSVTQTQISQLVTTILSFGGGAISGLLPVVFLYLLRRFFDVAIALAALFGLYLVMVPGFGTAMSVAAGTIGFWIGLFGAWFWLFGFPNSRFFKPTTYGSAEWADFAHIEERGYFSDRGFWLGMFPVPKRRQKREGTDTKTIRYAGDRHLLTVAPTRAGKGVSTIIPNLLTYPGSTLIVDPKGENALITVLARHKLGQSIFLVDPWGLVAGRFKLPQACFNPLDWLVPGDPDMAENAMLIADALVVPNENSKDQFWDEEAKALLMGLILYVATHPDEQKNRTLGAVRDLLLLGKDDMSALFQSMANSQHPIVASTGERCDQKDEKLMASVLAAAQAHTHFLDSPRIRESLSKSDFRFEDLKHRSISVYLILPADRLNAFGRWLRLLIQQAITMNARNIDKKPKYPILFMLDEMPSLGKLTMVEQAYSLMAGFGMQLWGIVQDVSQLEKIYGKGWQTFIANSGVLQYFGSRDEKTAEYFSKLCGKTTVITLSSAIATAISRTVASMGGGGSSSSTETTTNSQAEAQRDLAYADELMRLSKDRQLILIENANPIIGDKIAWYSDPRLESLGLNLKNRQST